MLVDVCRAVLSVKTFLAAIVGLSPVVTGRIHRGYGVVVEPCAYKVVIAELLDIKTKIIGTNF